MLLSILLPAGPSPWRQIDVFPSSMSTSRKLFGFLMSQDTSGFPNVSDHANLLPMSQEPWGGFLFLYSVQIRELTIKWPGKHTGSTAISNHGNILFYIKCIISKATIEVREWYVYQRNVSWLLLNPRKCLFLGNSKSLNQLTPMIQMVSCKTI